LWKETFSYVGGHKLTGVPVLVITQKQQCGSTCAQPLIFLVCSFRLSAIPSSIFLLLRCIRQTNNDKTSIYTYFTCWIVGHILHTTSKESVQEWSACITLPCFSYMQNTDEHS